MKKLKIAVLISNRGSNLEALIDACARPDFPAEIVLALSSNPNAPGLAHAERARIPSVAVDHKSFTTREAFEHAMQEELLARGVELVCLAGFMRLLSEHFVRAWEGRMINIHPSLLPAFKGLDTHARALAAGVKITGCTVHFVVPEMDSGPIIVQAAVPVAPEDTPATLAARVLAAEHQIYPMAVRQIAEGKIGKDGRITQGVALPPGETAWIWPSM